MQITTNSMAMRSVCGLISAIGLLMQGGCGQDEPTRGPMTQVAFAVPSDLLQDAGVDGVKVYLTIGGTDIANREMVPNQTGGVSLNLNVPPGIHEFVLTYKRASDGLLLAQVSKQQDIVENTGAGNPVDLTTQPIVTSGPGMDADGDGVPNLDEIRSATDPTSAADQPDSAYQVVTGGNWACALVKRPGQPQDRTVRCWGYNGAGQIGNNQESESPPVFTPTTVVAGSAGGILSNVAEIIAGKTVGCAIINPSTKDSAVCWGATQTPDAPLGIGPIPTTVSNRGLPYPSQLLLPAGTIHAISQGHSHGCAIVGVNQRVYCWGRAESGKLGNGNAATHQASPVEINNFSNATSIAAGENHTCATKTDNSVWCWGSNQFGQIGIGSDSIANSPVPQQVVNYNGGFLSAKKVVSGPNHTCAINTSNAVQCWGANGKEQLAAQGSPGDKSTRPTEFTQLGNGVTDLLLGEFHTCSIANSNQNKIFCAGNNQWGQLGNPALLSQDGGKVQTPVEVVGIQNIFSFGGRVANNSGDTLPWASDSSRDDSSCALLADDGIRCWGRNDRGQLGDGSTVDSYLPVRVRGFKG